MQNGHLVAMGDGLGWWAGDHFEKATQEERRRLDGEKRLTNTEFENDENGWSRRFFVTAPSDRKFTIDVGNKFQLSVINVAKGAENSTVSIDLLRPGKAPERIGDFDSREGRVGSAEYRRAFRDPE